MRLNVIIERINHNGRWMSYDRNDFGSRASRMVRLTVFGVMVIVQFVTGAGALRMDATGREW